jgi:tRNA splicing endonuclease
VYALLAVSSFHMPLLSVRRNDDKENGKEGEDHLPKKYFFFGKFCDEGWIVRVGILVD